MAAGSDRSSTGRWLVVAAAVAAVAGIWGWQQWSREARSDAVEVRVPQLSELARRGERAFAANCAACHGENAAGGTGKGPPLVHDIYNPGHHADIAFASAVRFGVRQHHWSFGNMPPRPEVSDADLLAIIAYVRELQRANGIVTRPHVMQ